MVAENCNSSGLPMIGAAALLGIVASCLMTGILIGRIWEIRITHNQPEEQSFKQFGYDGELEDDEL